MTAPILQIKGVTKRYGGLTANSDISFDVAPQEILSVIGPNASRISPQRKSPGACRLSRERGSISESATPPPVTSAFL